ncbi:transporter substrate-binding domain-containing protein [Vampirovibrio chlorellavorus]|uniref:transporter substrate-binding domain-containing protein n=1 Tax=Vampirovibrio chlorellavorus TaxID=758823 RepID=UPI0026EAAEE1|nr:transporter substrate-binding domain-containing protein [Vampirovibrio chlorellavorus]
MREHNRPSSLAAATVLRTAMPAALLVLGCVGLFALMACTHSQSAPTFSQIQQRGQLWAGVHYNSHPFAYLSAEGRPQGFDIDLLKEITRRLLGNAEAVRFHQVFASTRLMALNTGSLDLVAATLSITPERATLMDFSEPYFVAQQIVIVPKASPAKHLSDLRHKTILLVAGTTSEATIRARLPQARYRTFPTLSEALSAFNAKQGEALSSDDALLHGLLSERCDVRRLPETLSQELYGLAFRKSGHPHQSDSLKQSVNQALQAMRADGTLKRLTVRWKLESQPLKSCALPQAP